MKQRIPYCVTVIFIIFLGLLSRKVSIIPLWIGDALYAAMFFYIVKCLLPHLSGVHAALISFCICTLIELSQLLQLPLLITLRSTLIGRLVLGQGFLFSDLFAYMVGTIVALLFYNLFTSLQQVKKC